MSGRTWAEWDAAIVSATPRRPHGWWFCWLTAARSSCADGTAARRRGDRGTAGDVAAAEITKNTGPAVNEPGGSDAATSQIETVTHE